MREIKFRAWIPSQKIFSYFGLSACTLEDGALSEDEYKEAVITQFTGLKDKNGKEIYEGDIVKNYFTPKVFNNDHLIEPVIYNEQFGCFDPGYYSFGVMNPKYLEVLGNIYENPELL